MDMARLQFWHPIRRSEFRSGVTLIELVVVMAIIGIMALFMTPGIGEWVQNYRIKQAARDMASDFQFAKMKAVNLSGLKYCAVTFDITVDGARYDYLIYSDNNQNLEYDAGEGIFKSVIFRNAYRNVTFDTAQGSGDGNTFPNNTDSQPSVGFDSRGLPRNIQGNFQGGTVYLINTQNNKARRVDVTAAGAINITEYQ
jgi:prepilin-type N-terminal cleavage/methylation domain-containing protein